MLYYRIEGGESMREKGVLVVYYSLSGNTQFMAEEIQNYIGADLLFIEPMEQKIKPKGVMKFVWGGSQVKMKKKPELMPYTVDWEQYDTIILGTPIWASRHVPVLYAFLDREAIQGKDIAMFCCHAGGGQGKAFTKMKEQLPSNRFIGEIDFRDPKTRYTEVAIRKLREWLDDMHIH